MARKHRPKTHSLIDQYDRIPQDARIATMDIDDPYGVASDAVATVIIPSGAMVESEVVRDWQAPMRPRIRVIASLRDDVAAKMFARRQIDRPCFLAARDYQALIEVSAQSRLRTPDMGMVSSGGSGSRMGYLTDAQQRATKALHKVDDRIRKQLGSEGVNILHDVLGIGKTIARAARDRGDNTKLRIEYWGKFFRRCLRTLAEVLGFVSPGAYRHRRKQGA